MNLYWGDIHNHCDITYGYGSLQNALKRAKNHLDFCAITGHAMWPDMYERTEETAFVVDFHKEGFQKLYEHWDEVRTAIAEANDKDFVTFQAYEMHSSEYGDHHLVTPDDNLPLLYRDSPAKLQSDCGCDAITVAHHIGYTPGYRGIDWDKYDAQVTPLIEVCSKHGCAMSETAAYPYYHNMGPRDSRNTVYEGLRRGYRLGFVGSTDHHAGYPGSYGDGKLAVLAREKTREGIWEALKNRRTYAVTGDRIKCGFHINGHEMGSIVKSSGQHRHIHYSVEGCYAIDKIVIYKNLEPIKIVEGLFLKPKDCDRRFKLRIEMGWGKNTEDLYRWDGTVAIQGGKLLEVEPCFRGRSVLAPGMDQESNDRINDMDNQIVSQTDCAAAWQCFTVKNISPLHPQTCAVIVEFEGTRDSNITINVNGHERSLTIGELCRWGYTEEMKSFHSHAFKVHTMTSLSQYGVVDCLEDDCGDPAFYHMEVMQQNGQAAYVSPIYFE